MAARKDIEPSGRKDPAVPANLIFTEGALPIPENPALRGWLERFAEQEYRFVEDPYKRIAIDSILIVRDLSDQDVAVLAFDLDEDVVNNSHVEGYGSYIMANKSLSETLADLKAPRVIGGGFNDEDYINRIFKREVTLRLVQTRIAEEALQRDEELSKNVQLNHARNFTYKALTADALTRTEFD